MLDPEQPKRRNNGWIFNFRQYRRPKKEDTRIYHDQHERLNEEERLRELNNLKLRDEYDEEV